MARLLLFRFENLVQISASLSRGISNHRTASEDEGRSEVEQRGEEANVGEKTRERQVREGEEDRVVGSLERVKTGTHEGHEVSQVSAAARDCRGGEVRDRAAHLTQ